MSIFENLKSAFSSILNNKMRSVLTMLGIIIGIAAVIAISSIGNGTQAQIQEQFEGLGLGQITVSLRGNSRRNLISSDALTLDDYTEIKNKIQGIKNIAPVYSGNNAVVKYIDPKDTNTAQITGTTADYENIKLPTLLYGRYISDEDNQEAKKVVVINDTTAVKVFGESSPRVLNNKISIKTWEGTSKYTVVGITENENAETEALYDTEYPEAIIMPIASAQRLFHVKTISNIIVVPEDAEKSSEMSEEITNLLDKRHNTEDKYYAENPSEILDAATDTTGMLTLMISGIAAISLIVGGIGVMNIMLVTVTERTREIGIRKSIGAKNFDIMLQFVVEAIILTAMGGVLGILLGWGIGTVAAHFMDMKSVITAESVIISVSISCAIGIIFGVYPARKAAMLNPIEALRFE